MSAATKSNAKPAELGTKNFERIQRLLRATDNSLLSYRGCPNSPLMQSRKIALWSEYQECARELNEALNA